MKERPILFSALMVRALLNCTKSQTRRVAKGINYVSASGAALEFSSKDIQPVRCPYGQPSDHLYVRETWQHSNHPYGPADESCAIFYRADYWDDPHGMDGEKSPEGKYREWRPSIHMPRWASRILLEIVGVRVERLQEISISDAMAEGVIEVAPHLRDLEPCMEWRYAYEDLWRSINGPGSWEANPWVWVVEFKRVAQ